MFSWGGFEDIGLEGVLILGLRVKGLTPNPTRP